MEKKGKLFFIATIKIMQNEYYPLFADVSKVREDTCDDKNKLFLETLLSDISSLTTEISSRILKAINMIIFKDLVTWTCFLQYSGVALRYSVE